MVSEITIIETIGAAMARKNRPRRIDHAAARFEQAVAKVEKNQNTAGFQRALWLF
jgi:hypothetical protein